MSRCLILLLYGSAFRWGPPATTRFSAKVCPDTESISGFFVFAGVKWRRGSQNVTGVTMWSCLGALFEPLTSMTTSRLPKFAMELLSSCPTAGTGVHSWLFKCARVLHAFFPDKEELFHLMEDASKECGRHVPYNEIADAIQNSGPCAWRPDQRFQQDRKRRPLWPPKNYAQIQEIAQDGPTIDELESTSPTRFHGGVHHTEDIIDVLFPGDPLICCGTSPQCFDTRRRELWRGCMDALSLIVPSPMSARRGLKKNGKESARCLANTGPRKFLVVEFDFAEKDKDGRDTSDAPLLRTLAASRITVTDLCAALHHHLSKLAPLALIVHSGGKSLHGWFHAEGEPEMKVKRFMRYAVSLGADHATWTRCQFVRMPDGTRDNGKRQRVHYFNPGVLP
jgi:hypothetical protein